MGRIRGSDIPKALIRSLHVKDATIKKEDLKCFHSAEITADGTEQSTAHGLGATPTLVIVYKTADTRGTWAAWSLVEGTHDATNVKVTGTSGIKYRIFAMP